MNKESMKKAMRIASFLAEGIFKQERIARRLFFALQNDVDVQNGPLKLYDAKNKCIADGTMVNAEVTYDDTCILWFSGTFKGNLLSNCTFVDGTFKGGHFNGDEFSGTFESGDFDGGSFEEDGVFQGGSFNGGEFNGGTWINGSWKAPKGNWIWGKDKDGNIYHTPPPWKGVAEEDKRYVNFSGKIMLFDDATQKNKDKNPVVRNATFTKNGASLEWEDGTWMDGTWQDGIWNDGTWKNGTWKNGTWEDGIWETGIWKNGTWEGGDWRGGSWSRGFDKNGTPHPNSKTKNRSDSPDRWEEMIAEKESSYIDFTGMINCNGIHASVKKATFVLGTDTIVWKSGTWKSGTWIDGTWEDGTWMDGTWMDGIWCSGGWKTGLDSNGDRHDDSPDNWNVGASVADATGTYNAFTGTVKIGDTNGYASNASFEILANGGISWNHGTWEKGVLCDCDWHDGTFRTGVFSRGVFNDGIFENGMFNNGSVFNGGKWLETGIWSESAIWTDGMNSKNKQMATPPPEWEPTKTNTHHWKRDILIDQFIHLGQLLRTTFIWDEMKPNNPKIFKIYESGVTETINPFKNLLITRMTLSPDHITDYFCLPEYLGRDDNGKPVLGKRVNASAVPQDLRKRANFFKTFDNGEWLSDEPNIPLPVRDNQGNLTQYYKEAINQGWKLIP